ncbi:MAG: hypothetical protein ACYS3S_22550 [Planctomycetota bacterium]|jgi:hypothetical protein
MRFLALLKKELREAVPWIILSVIILFVISWFIIRLTAVYHGRDYYYGMLPNGKVIDQHLIFRSDIIQAPAVLMFFVSIGLGLVLGFRHFWMPGFTGTWQFLIHRSVSRPVIISAKLAAAAILMLCLSLAWLLVAGIAGMSERTIIPPESGIVGLGIFYAYLGFIVYMGTALCAITKARWYTTRMFGLFFVFIMFIAILPQTSFAHAFFISVVFFAVLIAQIYEIFLQREF